MNKILNIMKKEQILFDPASIATLRRSRGEERAREIVEEVIFHLTDRLGLLSQAMNAGDRPLARALAGRLAAASEQVGLVGFARVARDLGACLARGDAAAAAAVAARLDRMADRAICRLLDHADRSAL